MEKFNKKLKQYLTVYKTPIAPDSLDPTVFYFPETGEPPRLLPGIHAQVINDVDMFVAGQQPSRIKKVLIVGDVLIPGKQNRTKDITIKLVLNKDILDIDVDGIVAEEILKLADTLSNRQAFGTMRKIRYIPSLRDIELNEYPAVYDVMLQSWTKLPSGLQ